ncbi:hypothetical protein Tco_0638025 [Tanacetum coccineum]
MMYHPQTHIPLRSILGVLQIGIKSQDTVMSDSEDSTITYTEVVLQAPPSPDYMSSLEEPKQAPPLPDLIPKPVYPEFMPPEDEVLPAEEQPLPAAALPTTDLPGYVPESDLEEDPEKDDDEDPEEDPADYPADGGDYGDDEYESSDDDENDDVDIEGTLQLLLYQLISIRDEPPTPFWFDTEVARLLAIPTPPPSLLSLWSSPLPQIPSPPLRVSPPPPDTLPSGTPTLLPIPLPTSSPSLMLPSADYGPDRPEVCLPPRKRLCFNFGPRYKVGESSYAPTARPPRGFWVVYDFVATMDREIILDLERDVGYGITDT